LISVALLCSMFFSYAAAEMVARIANFEGAVSVMKKGAADWRNAKPGTPLDMGDQVFTHEESFAEIRYAAGAVLRMDEKTKVTIESSTEKTVRTKSAIGSVWVNMKKLITTGKQFEVSTPTAVAAIRGTVFDMSCVPDSATYVSVFEGKVAVGPTDSLKKKLELEKKKAARTEQPVEVPGPEEIPGPYEVSLEQWRTIVAGQKISVRSDGKFAQEKIDMKAAEKEKFVKKNQELDKELMKEKEK
jgi:ferric-dicitrate binding protein FerR (iron transport regulator)